MDIRIRVETRTPLSGYAGTEALAGRHFVGWLGLLRVLSELIGSRASLSNHVREVPPRGDAELAEDMGDVRLDRASGDE
jgi:hypothetical protein